MGLRCTTELSPPVHPEVTLRSGAERTILKESRRVRAWVVLIGSEKESEGDVLGKCGRPPMMVL